MFKRIGCRNTLLVGVGMLIALTVWAPDADEQPARGLPTRAVLAPASATPAHTPTARQAEATSTRAPAHTPTARQAEATSTRAPAHTPTARQTEATSTRAPVTATITITARPSEDAPALATLTGTPGAHYAARSANLRRCPETTCAVAGTVAAGTPLLVEGVVSGEAVTSGNARWYRVQHGGAAAYIYSGLVAQQRDAASAPAQSAPVSPPQTQSAPVAHQWNCSGDRYNCRDFASRAELMSYFNACPGDPSRLDNNNDGVPCESLR